MQMSHHTQKGSTLIEGLVAILIFSFALLGLAGFQLNMITAGMNANYRLQASNLASSIVGLAETNAENIGCFSLNAMSSLTCSAQPLADAAKAWEKQVLQAMPGSSAHKPTIEISGLGIMTVTVFWKAPKEDMVHNLIQTAYPITGGTP